MKSIQFLFYAVVAGVVALSSCAEEATESYDKFESQALEAYITQNKPELLANFQPVGDSGYYVEVKDEGNQDASPIGDGDMWLSYNFTGRSLDGSIVLTRNANVAKSLNTFTRYTHYVPYYRYCGADGADIQEGVYLAMRNELSLDNGARKIKLREGSKVVLYLPSLLIGSNGLEGSGGYEGETSLAASRPIRVELEICDTVKNPLELEGSQIDYFCEENGGREEPKKTDSESPSTKSEQLLPTDPKHPYNLTNRWVLANDSIAQLYINLRYDPAKDRLKFPASDKHKMRPYAVSPYNDAGLEEKIAQALVKRFHSDKAYSGAAALEADSVGLDKTVRIWYIGRFLDGFIFDTNINEVKELIYGKGYTAGEALEYVPRNGGLITAFYYTVQNLKVGQWATFVTTSTNGYGSSGQNGSSTTSSSGDLSAEYYDYLNYMSYYNSYYNNYYSGYYSDYYGGYGGYYGGYYDDYYSSYYDSATTTTTTTTTVTTEIPSYCPLIFQIYIDPNDTEEYY